MGSLLRPSATRGAIALWAALGALALGACGEETYPTGATEAAPPPAQTELMGAPSAPAPPVGAAPPVVAEAPSASPTFVPRTMAPVPNPGDPGSEPYYGPAVGSAEASASAYPVYQGETDEGRPAAEIRLRRPRRRIFETSASNPPTEAPAAASVQAPEGRSRRTTALSAPGAVRLPARVRPTARTPAPAAAPAGGPSPAASSGSQTDRMVADPAARLAALQAGLAPEFARAAVLSVPARLTPGAPAEVVLSVPSTFLGLLKDDAAAQGLAEASSSASLSATLSGAGYSVMPADPQSAPLESGAPTVLRWVVTPQNGPRSPLKAAVKATLLGGGATAVDLGVVAAKEPARGASAPRIVGAALLVLVGALVVAWLARTRQPSSGSEFSRRPAVRTRPPLDLTPPAPPPDRRG